MSSVGSSTTRATRTTTPSASGSRRPACGMCPSTANSSCFAGSGSSRRRATRGMQVVVVETGGRPVVVGGDVAVWFGELDEPHTEGQMRVRALDPELVWLAHEHQPWRPSTVADQPSQPHSA